MSLKFYNYIRDFFIISIQKKNFRIKPRKASSKRNQIIFRESGAGPQTTYDPETRVRSDSTGSGTYVNVQKRMGPNGRRNTSRSLLSHPDSQDHVEIDFGKQK